MRACITAESDGHDPVFRMPYTGAPLLNVSMAMSQKVIFISGGYCIYSFQCVFAIFGAGSRFVDFTIAAEALNPERIYWATYFQAYIAAVLLLLGIFGSLKFMWDVRHPKEG